MKWFITITFYVPQYREAFTLSRFEQLSYKMIAERMNVSVNTVEKHIGKALAIIRKEVKELDIIIKFFLFTDLHIPGAIIFFLMWQNNGVNGSHDKMFCGLVNTFKSIVDYL